MEILLASIGAVTAGIAIIAINRRASKKRKFERPDLQFLGNMTLLFVPGLTFGIIYGTASLVLSPPTPTTSTSQEQVQTATSDLDSASLTENPALEDPGIAPDPEVSRDEFSAEDAHAWSEESLETAVLLYRGTAIKLGDTIRMTNLVFELDEATLKSESESELQALVAFMSQYPNVGIEISGHTNKTANKRYSLRLSQQRADAVYQYLAKAGVDTARLLAAGYGYSQPIVAEKGGKSQANRRVEFKVIKLDDSDILRE